MYLENGLHVANIVDLSHVDLVSSLLVGLLLIGKGCGYPLPLLRVKDFVIKRSLWGPGGFGNDISI